MEKLFFFDTETSGTEPAVNSIVQISGMIDIDGEVVEEFDIYSRPDEDTDLISEEALKVQGRTLEEVMLFPPAKEAKKKLEELFCRHVSKYDKTDKLIPVAHNCRFDMGFLVQFWQRRGDNYLFSYLNSRRQIDTMSICTFITHLGFISPAGSKLNELCECLGINLDEAHNALSDIRATRELYYRLKRGLKWME